MALPQLLYWLWPTINLDSVSSQLQVDLAARYWKRTSQSIALSLDQEHSQTFLRRSHLIQSLPLERISVLRMMNAPLTSQKVSGGWALGWCLTVSPLVRLPQWTLCKCCQWRASSQVRTYMLLEELHEPIFWTKQGSVHRCPPDLQSCNLRWWFQGPSQGSRSYSSQLLLFQQVHRISNSSPRWLRCWRYRLCRVIFSRWSWWNWINPVCWGPLYRSHGWTQDRKKPWCGLMDVWTTWSFLRRQGSWTVIAWK